MLSPVDIEYFSKGIKSDRHLFECQYCKNTLGIKRFVIHLADIHNEDVSNKYWTANLLRCTRAAAIFEVTEEFIGGEPEIVHAVENYIKPKEREFVAFQVKEKEKKEKLLRIERQNSEKEKSEKMRAAILYEEKRAKQILDTKINESTVVYLTWDDIIFDKNKISFKHKTEFILSVDMQGIVKELNLLKNEYFKKHYNTLLKFLVHKSMVLKDQSSGWEKLQNTISLVEERVKRDKSINLLQKRKHKSINLPPTDNLNNIEIVEKFAGNGDKFYYIRFLAGIHYASQKIIPIIEKIGNVKEVSFIFTIKGKKYFYLIWENCNDKRGAHIFVTSKDKFNDVLHNLKLYIQSDEIDQKRNVFWQSDSKSINIKKYLNHFKSLKHIDRSSFVKEMKSLMK